MKKRILYLGLSSQNFISNNIIVDYPIIKIRPFNLNDKVFDEMWSQFELFSHVLFTSQTTVELLLNHIDKEKLQQKELVAIGKKTEKKLWTYGLTSKVCSKETAEGVVEYIKDLKNPHILYLHSKSSRPIISQYLQKHKISHFDGHLYETHTRLDNPKIDLDDFDEVFFTSPSTVDAFKIIFKEVPDRLHFLSIGPITDKYLKDVFKERYPQDLS